MLRNGRFKKKIELKKKKRKNPPPPLPTCDRLLKSMLNAFYK